MRRGINQLEHVLSNIINNHQVNYVIDNELKFDISNRLAHNHVKYPPPKVIIRLRGVKKYIQTLNTVITCLLDRWDKYRIIKHKHINPYNFKLRSNNVKSSKAAGPCRTTYDVKISFSMLEFSSRKIRMHHFYVDNTIVDKGIVYEMIKAVT